MIATGWIRERGGVRFEKNQEALQTDIGVIRGVLEMWAELSLKAQAED